MTVDPDALARAVQEALDRDVRGRLQGHMGDITIGEISPEGDVTLHFLNACHNCQARGTTAALTVLPVVQAVPGVRSAQVANVWMSKFAVARLAKRAQRR
jgi:Fe-S cluster biogenesis protein NfuA